MEEMKKVFRCYDNDDDGQISVINLQQCADVLELADSVNEINLLKMIQVGDTKNKGYVDQKDFLALMKKLGLMPEPEKKIDTDLEKAYKKALEEKKRKNKIVPNFGI